MASHIYVLPTKVVDGKYRCPDARSLWCGEGWWYVQLMLPVVIMLCFSSTAEICATCLMMCRSLQSSCCVVHACTVTVLAGRMLMLLALDLHTQIGQRPSELAPWLPQDDWSQG